MRIPGFAAALLCAALLAASPPDSAAGGPPPAAQTFYDRALDAMRNLPQPAYVTYGIVGQGVGLDVDLETLHHLVWLELTNEPNVPSGPVTWHLQHRTYDYSTEITTEDGRRYVSTRAFFDPTWYGAFRALREGMLFYQQTDEPIETPPPSPAPGASPDLRTIAVVEVIGSNIYAVDDRGPEQCGNGDPGHALQLTSRKRDPHHQLSYVVVDTKNMRFCTIRFDTSQRGGTGGYVEQHYGTVGGYWMQTDGEIFSAVRVLGVTVTQGTWDYKIYYGGFPPTLPPSTFVPYDWQ